MKTEKITITISSENDINVIKMIDDLLLNKVLDHSIIQFGIDGVSTKITDNNKFNLFNIYELELIRKSMIHSVKNHILQGEDFGKLKWLWAELDDELMRKRIIHQKLLVANCDN